MLDWINTNRDTLPVYQRVHLWDKEQKTATVGHFEVDTEDDDTPIIVFAYGEYYELSCFSHYALIEPPTQ